MSSRITKTKPVFLFGERDSISCINLIPPSPITKPITFDSDFRFLVLDVNADLLINDDAGPADEPQGLDFVSAESTTSGGGMVQVVGSQLTYQPAAGFSGIDSFTYQVAEIGDPTSIGQGTVYVDVIANDDPPIFIGEDGVIGYQAPTDDLAFTESKAVPQTFVYDLNSWFQEPSVATQ